MNKSQLKVAWVAGILFLSITSVSAQEKHPIDKSLEECISNSKYITAEMVKCAEEATAKWEAELDKYYNLLMGILDDEAKERLRQSQSAWERFKALEFEFIPYHYTDPGSYQGPATAKHEMAIVKERALQLQEYYEQAKEGLELMKGLSKDE